MIREFDNDRWNGYPYMTNERVREKCLEICRSSSERKSMESKPRILYLQKILLERTDEENMLSTTQLINILNDVKKENTLLTVSYGIVVYDAVSETNLLGN